MASLSISAPAHPLRAACTLMILAGTLSPGASLLEQRIDELRRTTVAIQAGHAGIEILQLGTGKILYSLNAGSLLTPASNTKLFSTALALTRLGPDYRLTTSVWADQAPNASGRIDGNLVLVGAGDPSMSFIALPYIEGADPADPRQAIEDFADQLVAQGIRSVAGDIVGDDTAFPAEFFPPGWAVDDPMWEYGAPVSALCIGNASVKLDILPGARPGDPATVRLTPPLEYFFIDNRVRTVASGEPQIEERRSGGRELTLSGTVSAADGVFTEWLAVDDPALYAASALYDALVRRGISIGGHPRARHRYGAQRDAPRGVTLVDHRSPPLKELLRVTDKISQNLWAELMLRAVALAGAGDGSRTAGLSELKVFLEEAGIPATDTVFEDGSGLSRLTLVKPDAVVRLLRYMKSAQFGGKPLGDVWTSLLPVGGVDGTLEKRFGKNPAARNVHAKTGSLSHVNALSGYADSATYGEVAFSIIVNNTSAPASEVRDFIDKLVMILLE